jgi:uncharacterized protein DUF5681
MEEENTTTIVESKPNHLFQKGESGNPNGRPKGSVGFKTKWDRLMKRLSEEEKISVEELGEMMLKTAFEKAKEGDFQYYKDIMDRLYGRPKDAVSPVNVNFGEIHNNTVIEQPVYEIDDEDISLLKDASI